MKTLLLLIFCVPLLTVGQNTRKDSVWLPLKSFIGQWAGEGGREPGKGFYERTYQFILNKILLKLKINQPTNPQIKIQQEKYMKTLVILAMTKP